MSDDLIARLKAVYFLSAFLFWIILTRNKFADDKRSDGVALLMGWFMWPAVLTVYLVIAFLTRRQFRWLRRRWMCIAIDGCFSFLENQARKGRGKTRFKG